MDIHEVIRQRRSVRAYTRQPVSDAQLERLLQAVRWAPSARNLQPYRLVVVRDAATRRVLAQAANEQEHVEQAAVVIAAVALDPERVMTCRTPACPVDVAIALTNLTLAATAEGLGTCWIGAFQQDRVRQILGVPDTCQVTLMMTLGHPADQPGERTRKPLEELVCWEAFS